MRISSQFIATVALALALATTACKVDGDETSGERDQPEARVDDNALPINVTAADRGVMPNCEITEAEKETRKGRMVYSLDVQDGAKKYDVIVSPDGQILETKEERH
jgi:uncharacterized membrane protein YkoI